MTVHGVPGEAPGSSGRSLVKVYKSTEWSAEAEPSSLVMASQPHALSRDDGDLPRCGARFPPKIDPIAVYRVALRRWQFRRESEGIDGGLFSGNKSE